MVSFNFIKWSTSTKKALAMDKAGKTASKSTYDDLNPQKIPRQGNYHPTPLNVINWHLSVQVGIAAVIT